MQEVAEEEPWTIPVPVRSSTFVALHRADAAYNVEVDLGAVGAFFASPAKAVGFADFQLLPDGVSRGRLGAGRALQYRGHYLKGVGRTPLAANWRLSDDARHASGHLFPSAAARELLVSRYAAAHGLADAIVPCTGLLVRPLPARARAEVRASLPPGPVPAIDLRLQAISVKPGGFARLSNFTWALHQLEAAHRQLGELSLAMQRHLDPTATVAPRECTPRTVMDALARAIDRGFANFERYFAAGIHWGYIDNNLTADGRFLDLEVPAVLGGAALGVHDDGPPGPRRASGRRVGLDAHDNGRRVRIFVEDLESRLRFLEGSCALQHPLVRRFAGALADELARALPRSHPVRSSRALARWTEASLTRALALGATARRRLRATIAARQRFVDEQVDAGLDGEVREVDLEIAIHAPGVQRRFRQPAWAPPASAASLEAAARYNAALIAVDATRSADELLGELRRLTRRR
jgi:hypothetical protein